MLKDSVTMQNSELPIFESFMKTIIVKNKLVKVDSQDFDNLSLMSWYLCNGYARNNKGYMHQLILGKQVGMDTDHINQDKLDNRRRNLRPVSRSLNMLNVKRSGVTYLSTRKTAIKKWRAQLRQNGEYLLDKRYLTKEEAERAYQETKAKYFDL